MLIEFLATIMGIVMSLGYYPQIYRILKTKSVKNISLTTFLIFSLGTTTWLLYGIYLKDWVIFLSFILGVVGSWSIVILNLIYRSKN